MATIDASNYIAAWETEDFSVITDQYDEASLNARVQGVAKVILDSIKSTEQILPYCGGLDFASAVQQIIKDQDAKRGSNTLELIDNASTLRRYLVVKAIDNVMTSRPDMQKTDIVVASLLFGIRDLLPLNPSIEETLTQLRNIRAQYAGVENPFLAQVDAKIREMELLLG